MVCFINFFDSINNSILLISPPPLPRWREEHWLGGEQQIKLNGLCCVRIRPIESEIPNEEVHYAAASLAGRTRSKMMVVVEMKGPSCVRSGSIELKLSNKEEIILCSSAT